MDRVVVANVVGVAIPACSSQTGLRSELAKEVQEASNTDRLWWRMMKGAKQRLFLLKKQLSEKVIPFENRFGSLISNKKDFGEDDVEDIKQIVDEHVAVVKSFAASSASASVSDNNNKKEPVRREREEESKEEEKEKETEQKEEKDQKPQVPPNDASSSDKNKKNSSEKEQEGDDAKQAVEQEFLRRRQQQETTAKAKTTTTKPTAPPTTVRQSKVFGLMKGIIATAAKQNQSNSYAQQVLNRRNEIQQKAEKTQLITDVQTIYSDVKKLSPKVNILIEKSKKVEEVKNRTALLYKRVVIEEEHLAHCHFFVAKPGNSSSSSNLSNNNSAADASSSSSVEKTTTTNTSEKSFEENENEESQEGKKKNLYPSTIPHESIFWVPANHTEKSESKLQQQLMSSVERYEELCDEIRELIMKQQLQRQADEQFKSEQQQQEREHQTLMKQQINNNVPSVASAASTTKNINQNQNQQQQQEEDEDEDDVEVFEFTEEELAEVDPTMMMD